MQQKAREPARPGGPCSSSSSSNSSNSSSSNSGRGFPLASDSAAAAATPSAAAATSSSAATPAAAAEAEATAATTSDLQGGPSAAAWWGGGPHLIPPCHPLGLKGAPGGPPEGPLQQLDIPAIGFQRPVFLTRNPAAAAAAAAAESTAAAAAAGESDVASHFVYVGLLMTLLPPGPPVNCRGPPDDVGGPQGLCSGSSVCCCCRYPQEGRAVCVSFSAWCLGAPTSYLQTFEKDKGAPPLFIKNLPEEGPWSKAQLQQQFKQMREALICCCCCWCCCCCSCCCCCCCWEYFHYWGWRSCCCCCCCCCTCNVNLPPVSAAPFRLFALCGAAAAVAAASAAAAVSLLVASVGDAALGPGLSAALQCMLPGTPQTLNPKP